MSQTKPNSAPSEASSVEPTDSSKQTEHDLESFFLELPESLMIQDIESLYGILLDASQKKQRFLFDASNVGRLSTAFLQLLLSLSKSLDCHDGLIIQKPSQYFIQCFEHAGLTLELKKWSESSYE